MHNMQATIKKKNVQTKSKTDNLIDIIHMYGCLNWRQLERSVLNQSRNTNDHSNQVTVLPGVYKIVQNCKLHVYMYTSKMHCAHMFMYMYIKLNLVSI